MSKGICFGCGCWFDNLEEHHLYPGARRDNSERYGMKVRLCPWCHRLGRNAVHQCRETRIRLQKLGEKKFLREHPELGVEGFIALFDRNYLDEEELPGEAASRNDAIAPPPPQAVPLPERGGCTSRRAQTSKEGGFKILEAAALPY